jgi:hypothetical protein
MSKIYDSLKKAEHERSRKQREGEEKICAYIRRRRITWEPVLEAASCVVYVSPELTLFNPENFRWGVTHGVMSKVVIGKNELILPDEWPEFPREQGIYYIGITAKDEVGNESSPFILEGLFKFIPPQPPSNGRIEYL